ncbi:MAG: hypothetical protein V4547_18825 [Bacteroidota bacterium]
MDKISFLELFRIYISYHTKAIDKFEVKKAGTIRAYSCKYKILNEFLIKKESVKLKAVHFDMELSKKLSEWLIESKYGHNYSVRVREICRLVLQHGAINSLISTNPLSFLKLKRSPPKKPPYFTKEQMKAFEVYTSDSSLKTKAAHMFLIQLNSGFDYGDFNEVGRHLKVLHRGQYYIVKPRNKNGNESIIPINPVLERMLEMYDYKIKLLSNVKFNLYIKLVAKEIGIPFWQGITTKDGRKLFMMNKLNNEGYSIQAVSKMGGHTTISTTEKYYAQANINLISNELEKMNTQTAIEF